MVGKDEKESQLLEKSFDYGYFLAKNCPDIADTLAQIESSSPIFQAFKAGKETHDFEQRNRDKSPLDERFERNKIRDLFNEKSKPADRDNPIDQEPER